MRPWIQNYSLCVLAFVKMLTELILPARHDRTAKATLDQVTLKIRALQTPMLLWGQLWLFNKQSCLAQFGRCTKSMIEHLLSQRTTHDYDRIRKAKRRHLPSRSGWIVIGSGKDWSDMALVHEKMGNMGCPKFEWLGLLRQQTTENVPKTQKRSNSHKRHWRKKNGHIVTITITKTREIALINIRTVQTEPFLKQSLMITQTVQLEEGKNLRLLLFRKNTGMHIRARIQNHHIPPLPLLRQKVQWFTVNTGIQPNNQYTTQLSTWIHAVDDKAYVPCKRSFQHRSNNHSRPQKKWNNSYRPRSSQ